MKKSNSNEPSPKVSVSDQIARIAHELKNQENYSNIILGKLIEVIESKRWKLGDQTATLIESLLGRKNINLAMLELPDIVKSLGELQSETQKLLHQLAVDLQNSPSQHIPGNKTGSVYRFDTDLKIVFYTAIVNGYDDLPEHQTIPINADFVCFTNNTVTDPGIFRIQSLPIYYHEPARISRFIKTHPNLFFEDYDISVWIDANLTLTDNFTSYLKKVIDGWPLATWKHPFRSSVYEEFRACLKADKDSSDIMSMQIERYKSLGFTDNRLYETSIVIRRHNSDISQLIDRLWWSEIQNGSIRDQLSLPFVTHSIGFQPAVIRDDTINMRNDSVVFYRNHLVLPKPHRTDGDVYRPAISKKVVQQFINHNLKSITYVVCVHNAWKDVLSCLNSLLVILEEDDSLVIINDGSDKYTSENLANWTSKHVTSIQNYVVNEKPLGYTKSANIGMKLAETDYIALVNSDTILPKDFKRKMLFYGELHPRIGIIGPLSNAASWQNIPDLFDENHNFSINTLPKGVGLEQVNRLCALQSEYSPLFVPILNGFCLLIKKEVVEDIGYFDEDNFPKGYGEENDFCIRAEDNGWLACVATNTYVWHAKSKSFGHKNRQELSRQGSDKLRQKHGNQRLDSAIASLKNNPVLKEFREKIGIFFVEQPSVPLTKGQKKLIGVIGSGSKSNPNGSTYIRLLELLEHNKLDYTLIDDSTDIEELHHSNVTSMVIQRCPKEPNKILDLIKYYSLLQVPFIFEIDDHLLDHYLEKSNHINDNQEVLFIIRVLFASDNVITSTTSLKNVMKKFNPRVHVTPNSINLKTWKLEKFPV